MTIAEAWYDLFLSYGLPPGKRTAYQARLAHSCIYFALGLLRITGKVRRAMKDEIVGSVDSYLCTYIRKNQITRAQYCYLQYLIAGGK